MVWKSASLRYEMEHEREDELVVLVVKAVHELDYSMVVNELEDVLLEEIEKFGWWFEQDINGENEDDNENKLVMTFAGGGPISIRGSPEKGLGTPEIWGPPVLQEWDRYKDLLRTCPHHGFTELNQLDTFYNALNPADQDSLNSPTGGNLLERRTQDVLTIIKKNLSVNTFPELRDNIQGYVAVAAVSYNQGNSVYRPPGMANQNRPPGFAQPNVKNNQNQFSQPQGYNRGNNFNPEQSYQAPTQQNQVVPLSELEKVKRMNEDIMKAIQTQINNVKNKLRNEMKNSILASMSNQTNELKNMMASQMNTASTLRSGSLPSNTIEDERVEETLTDQDLAEYTIKVPPPLVQKSKPPSQRNFVLHINITLADALSLVPKYQKMLKALLSNKEKLLELLKCKALVDLGASINLMPLSVWKKLGLPELISTRMTLELANRAIYTPAGIARDVFVPVGKFTFPADFIIVDYESDLRVSLILGRPFLWTAHTLIDVHREEMILHDGDERLTLNMRHDSSSYSSQPKKESINMINNCDDSNEDFLKELCAKKFQSGNPTFSYHPKLASPKVKKLILIKFSSLFSHLISPLRISTLS
uniref:Reverse transcriptase domain-containing protein n=1 Tax=Tanacetum cinerariifolium TaxID=118510 RepID=A0A6L2NP85_TANCI|nr:hypothetical protein [Tanacetum cinerariifolium]